MVRCIFFGSTDDSVSVATALLTSPDVSIVCVVTQPPRPVGRKQHVTPTQVETWAKTNDIPVVSFATKREKPWEYASEETVIETLEPFKADILVSASYGQKIPTHLIEKAKYGGLNVHPSILPRWRGTDPVPWTIMAGDHQTGVTIVTLSTSTFDTGRIIAQEKTPVTERDTTPELRKKLFAIGTTLLSRSLPGYLSGSNPGAEQVIRDHPYARRLTRDDGFEPWEKITEPADAPRINRKFRALSPWPGLWTLFNGKRLKILSFSHEPETVQLEGKNPVSWKQFVTAYLAS